MSDNPELARRWRLILGRYAEQNLPSRAVDNDLESTLSFLYDRAYAERGHRHAPSGKGGNLGERRS